MSHDEGDGFDVRSLSVTYREGHVLEAHDHPWAQLVYARSGLLNVETPNRVWFVPPTRAVWIPPRTQHSIEFASEVALRTLYISAQRARGLADEVVTLEVSPLLSELIQHIQRLKMLDAKVPKHAHLSQVLVDLISEAQPLDLALPLPTDERAAALAQHFRAHPGERRGLKHLAEKHGASLRTMQRRFTEETGMPLDTWRQKGKLIHAVKLLAEGQSVADAGHRCGYEGTSAFVAAFKKQFGVTPGRFKRSSRAVHGNRVTL